MRVLGVEGTAWAASAAVYDAGDADPGADAAVTGSDSEGGGVFVASEAYEPESGGIHPREAAEHMREHVPRVVDAALTEAAARHDGDGPPVDAVAFSRGPGLGPCLRIAATAARAVSLSFDVPLVGVNHMVAHLEIGRHNSGFEAPVCLNASGANAHVLAYRNGRYRVLGETMDTGVGNAIDKFTRHLGWSHPGGPKVEREARDGEYVELPYVVKGMDFSFSGIASAAQQAVDDGVPVADVCFALQETVFAMLTEVSERALSLTGRDELVLGGGVGQNARLREMLAEMCETRGADFSAPEPRFLRDNAGMIAVLGARQFEVGDTLAVADSAVDPEFRPDEVAVTWREADPVVHSTDGPVRGAEATVEMDAGTVTKRRVPKSYRHPDLDARLRRERVVAEARLTSEARRHGVPTPVVFDVDREAATLVLERVGTADLRDALSAVRVRDVGRHLATIHRAGFVHGDPTTRNVRVDESGDDDRTYLIDFGLGYYTRDVEDFAMDLHVFEGSLVGTADDPEPLIEAFADAYDGRGPEGVLGRLEQVARRGRYRTVE